MATTTTNYGLTKPAYSDTADIADINGNMDTIDSVLKGQADALGIVVDGDKTAYSSGAAIGQYIILKNSTITGCDDGLYTAAKAIPYNTSIDSTYLTAVDGGGLNALKASATWKQLGTLSNATGTPTNFTLNVGVNLLNYAELFVEFKYRESSANYATGIRIVNPENDRYYYSIMDGAKMVFFKITNSGGSCTGHHQYDGNISDKLMIVYGRSI